jgi:lysylphosphatidylglycerol synthetase-like protein (DUF2156 family)
LRSIPYFAVGGLLVVPDGVVTFRLVAALLTGLVWLMLLLVCSPYKRAENNVLAITAAFVLLCTYFGALLIKVHTDITSGLGEHDGVALTSDDISTIVSSALSFETTNEIAGTMTVFAFLVVLLVVFALLQGFNSPPKTIRLAATKRKPELSMDEGCTFHGFISHSGLLLILLLARALITDTVVAPRQIHPPPPPLRSLGNGSGPDPQYREVDQVAVARCKNLVGR